MSVQLYIDPECRLSKVPYRVPNNTHYVTHDQYELTRLQLQSEVERLTAFTTRTIIPNEELQAQVERLTKAGDNLEQVLTEISYSYRAGNASHEWRAAKGVQS